MKETTLTKEQNNLLINSRISFETAVFLEELNLFKLTYSDGTVCCFTLDLSESTYWISNIISEKVVDGKLEITL